MTTLPEKDRTQTISVVICEGDANLPEGLFLAFDSAGHPRIVLGDDGCAYDDVTGERIVDIRYWMNIPLYIPHR